jgi:uncharacterized BrkB/YihY/UPF0761 family membrane protein
LPPVVAAVLEPVARRDVARSGWLLWLGGLVGLWTVGSLIETIRDILRRAYGTREAQAFWRYRLIVNRSDRRCGVACWLRCSRRLRLARRKR